MIEQKLQQGLFGAPTERSFIDKMLAKQDVDYIRELMRKERLNRSELLELLYMCLSTESKLLNYSEWSRYVILKYFVWIREFIKIAELLFDYQDFLKKQEASGKIMLTERTRQLLDNNERLIEHNAKFLIDLYLNIGRTSLSLGATGLMELLTNKYEVVYPDQKVGSSIPAEPRSGGLFGLNKKGG